MFSLSLVFPFWGVNYPQGALSLFIKTLPNETALSKKAREAPIKSAGADSGRLIQSIPRKKPLWREGIPPVSLSAKTEVTMAERNPSQSPLFSLKI